MLKVMLQMHPTDWPANQQAPVKYPARARLRKIETHRTPVKQNKHEKRLAHVALFVSGDLLILTSPGNQLIESTPYLVLFTNNC